MSRDDECCIVKAMRARRRELISAPLDRIYRQLFDAGLEAMRDHSISLFHLEGAPVLEHRETQAGTRVTFGEIGSIHGVDFYIPPEHAERTKRAVAAFAAVMNEVAQEAAE